MKNIILKCYEGLDVRAYLYEPSEKPKAAILLVHGMMEHAARYDDFAKFLVGHGYAVLTPDLRGHGKTAKSVQQLGYDSGDIYQNTIEDLKIMLAWLKKSYSAPVYVFSHSYGSMLAQTLMQKTDIAQKYVLCGTGNGEAFIMKLANKLAKSFAGDDPGKKATKVEKLSFGAYGKKFKNGNWFTRDEKVFEAYLADEYCGGSFPYSFYISLFSNLTKANSGIKDIPQSTEIFLIVGSKDPVGSNSKQVKALYKKYAKAGKQVQMKIYKDCRHELINELNKADVYEDVLRFYEN